VYAGAYAFGCRGTTVALVEGRKRIIRSSIRRPADSWEVLIKDHHEGYISSEEFVRNQEIISDNVNGKSYLGRGSVLLIETVLRCQLRMGFRSVFLRTPLTLNPAFGLKKTSSLP